MLWYDDVTIYISEVTWSYAAEKVRQGDASIIPKFLNRHHVDEEGEYYDTKG